MFWPKINRESTQVPSVCRRVTGDSTFLPRDRSVGEKKTRPEGHSQGDFHKIMQTQRVFDEFKNEPFTDFTRAENAAAIHVYEKVGMRRHGSFRSVLL